MYKDLFYNRDLNRFYDFDGNIIHDLHDTFDPWQLDVIKNIGASESYFAIENNKGRFTRLYFKNYDCPYTIFFVDPILT